MTTMHSRLRYLRVRPCCCVRSLDCIYEPVFMTTPLALKCCADYVNFSQWKMAFRVNV